MKPAYFKSAAEFRTWLHRHHATESMLIVGFYKKASGRGGLTYFEAVDELLCFGWIDGLKRRIDDAAYSHRMTPRRATSTWSNVNVRNVARLRKAGKMHAAGLAAFAARSDKRTGTYTYERPRSEPRLDRLPVGQEKAFQKQPSAWKFWLGQAPGHRRAIVSWITSAQQPATRARRLARLIAASARLRRLFA